MLFYYFIAINVLAFSLMGIDKRKAVRNQWRIPEKTLFLSALLGGSIGSITGMYFFRHKTRHKSFTLGMPAIFILQLLLLIFFFYCKVHNGEFFAVILF